MSEVTETDFIDNVTLFVYNKTSSKTQNKQSPSSK